MSILATPAATRQPAAGPSGLDRWRFGPPTLALLAAWVALFSWSEMVTEPLDFLIPTLVIGAVMVLVGVGLRGQHVPAYVVSIAQLLVVLLSLNVAVAQDESRLGFLPTEESVRRSIYVIGNGAATLNHYAAPVGVNASHTRALLLACSLAVLLSVEFLAMWLRRLPLVALPLLVTLSVPVSILEDALTLPIFVGTALLFLRLLGTDHLDRLRTWGRDRTAPPRAQAGALWQVSTAAVVVALVGAPLVPVADLLDTGAGTGGGAGPAGRYQLTVVNPFIRLRRDLVEMTHTPMVYAETESRSTSYLRTTVLDEFTGDSWRPSARSLPSENMADGDFPSPPGLGPGVGGANDRWSFQLAPDFATTWLPLPYPLRSLEVTGNWRYDSRTLDVAFVGGGAPSRLTYSAVAFTPAITAELLESTVSAPAKVRVANTALPQDLPDVIERRAREVTRGAETSFARAVALQDWFRSEGGFEYSVEERGGSGMNLLADFVTDDRVGYCEQFAAAMAAMGRTLDIPSRVVVGFLGGEELPDGRTLYTSDDRHAWPEMYFSGVGWVRFEPTPGQRAGSTPPWTRQDANPDDPSSSPIPDASQAPVPLPEAAGADASGADGSAQVPWWPLAGLAVVLLVGVVPALVRRTQRRRRLAGRDLVDLSEGAWAELRATALDMGLDWVELRSPREQARKMMDQVRAPDEDVSSLEGLLAQVERGRYGRAGTLTVDPDTRSQTLSTVAAWRRVLIGSVDRERGWRGRVWPVSLLRRARRSP